jgi:F-box protein 21
LAIIYESVGRRLGLLFEPINFPAHFLLRFCENDGPRTKKYYIDTFNGGNVMQKTACPYRTRTEGDVFFPVATAAKVVERIANNLELSTRQHVEHNGRVTHLRSILELLKLVSPQDLSALVSLAKLYMLHRINTKSLEDYLATQVFYCIQALVSRKASWLKSFKLENY